MARGRGKKLTASLEDYLEAIFWIVEKKHAARAKDVVDRLGVSGSSVTEALQGLARKGMINYAPYDIVTLTEAGREVANRIVRRHELLGTFFHEILGLDDDLAAENACRIEHAIGDLALERLAAFVEFALQSAHSPCRWHGAFGRSLGNEAETSEVGKA